MTDVAAVVVALVGLFAVVREPGNLLQTIQYIIDNRSHINNDNDKNLHLTIIDKIL